MDNKSWGGTILGTNNRSVLGIAKMLGPKLGQPKNVPSTTLYKQHAIDSTLRIKGDSFSAVKPIKMNNVSQMLERCFIIRGIFMIGLEIYQWSKAI